MQALILAAGMGKRLGKLTSNHTKCMVEVNGITLIERMLIQLEQLHLSRIIIVTGYEGAKLQDYIMQLQGRNKDWKTKIKYIENQIYDKTNNIYSLALAKEYLLKEDTLLLESDLIFEEDVLKLLIEDKRDTLALVDKYESWMDGTVIRLDQEDNILEVIPKTKFSFNDIPGYYKTVNIYKFSRNFSRTHYVPFLDAYCKALGNNEYYEQVLRVIAMLDEPVIKAKRLNGQRWYEIDDIQDLDIAESLFTCSGTEEYQSLLSRFGGYWRYPKLLDFCYLVNPYFPSDKLMDEMRCYFKTLVTQYPSGMKINCLLAARNFGIKQEHIVIGNGAAELIKELMESKWAGNRIGLIKPTFEEYFNRLGERESVVYIPENENFNYGANDLIQFFQDKEIDTLVLINPDNPTGNYINKQELLLLINWGKKEHIKLIIDESFVDFADVCDEDSEENTLLNEDILSEYDGLCVVKSISKSYGIPGVRIGILAGCDEKMIQCIKHTVCIWNINSLGEFFMQILGKYKKEYKFSLVRIRESRSLLVNCLKEIPGLRVIPTQANYIMCELCCNTSAAVCAGLLSEQILIKDLTGKIQNGRQYIRVAVRSEEDNDRLVSALKKYIPVR